MAQGLVRARWAAAGAAIAVALGAGGIGLVNATTSSGEKAIYQPIQPCRLADTRAAATQGPRHTPLGANETYTLNGWGVVGDCDLPSGVTGLALNVTALNATTQTFLTLWPTGGTLPTTSNLNPAPGQPPTPNAVNVDLNGSGQFNIRNNSGTVNVLIDVVGYYDDHNHDDRYYTKSQVDAKFASTVTLTVGAAAFQADGADQNVWTAGCMRSSNASQRLLAGVQLPVGATVTEITGYLLDYSGTANGTLTLVRTTLAQTAIATATSSGTSGLQNVSATAAAPETVGAGEYFYLQYSSSESSGSMQICGAAVTYTIPAGTSVQSAGAGVADSGSPTGIDG